MDMHKKGMVRDLLEVLRRQRYQAYVRNLSRIITTVVKDKREKFAHAYYAEVEALESIEMAKCLELFNGCPEGKLERIFSSPVSLIFGPSDMPTRHDYWKAMARAQHVASCPKCISRLYS